MTLSMQHHEEKKHSKKKRSVNLIPGVGCSLCMDSIKWTSQAEENLIHANVICMLRVCMSHKRMLPGLSWKHGSSSLSMKRRQA